MCIGCSIYSFFKCTAPTGIYTLALPGALPILCLPPPPPPHHHHPLPGPVSLSTPDSLADSHGGVPLMGPDESQSAVTFTSRQGHYQRHAVSSPTTPYHTLTHPGDPNAHVPKTHTTHTPQNGASALLSALNRFALDLLNAKTPEVKLTGV